MNRKGARSGLYGIVAAFSLFTAYDLFKARNDTETTMTPLVRDIFIVFFTLAGVALIVYAWWYWKHNEKDHDREDDGKGMK